MRSLFNMEFMFAFLVIVKCNFFDFLWQKFVDPNDCGATVMIQIFPNGGNNSGETGYWFNVVKSYDQSDVKDLISQAATLVYNTTEENTQNYRLATRFATPVLQTVSLENGSVYFLVPPGDLYIWPSMYVGYKVKLEDPHFHNGFAIMETLSLQPRLFLVENFLSHDETDYMVNTSLPKMQKSRVVENDGNKFHQGRTSSSTWLWKNEGQQIINIDRRCGILAGGIHPLQRQEEAIQVVHYLPGQYYHSHYDFFDPQIHKNPYTQSGINRLLTIFFYLNDVEEGGATVFPFAAPSGYKLFKEEVNFSDCTRGLKVQPKKNSAIMWYSLLADGHMRGAVDYNSLHGACPPFSGEKIAANKWISNKRSNGATSSYDQWNDEYM